MSLYDKDKLSIGVKLLKDRDKNRHKKKVCNINKENTVNLNWLHWNLLLEMETKVMTTESDHNIQSMYCIIYEYDTTKLSYKWRHT